MARPIGNTPELYGEDAERVLKSMDEPLTDKEKEVVERIKRQRTVLF
ncbi:MAG: hypothetical protein Q4Q22_08515 [Methanosphaera sp.]|nr:hypothetical protein [Methanosphaera sp.]